MAERKDGYSQKEITEAIVDTMPSEGKCIISLGGQTYLLSVSASVGEKGLCKLWVQGKDAIQVDGDGPIGPYNQLIYRARVMDKVPKIVLYERHGYPSIEWGEEVESLGKLLFEGEQDWWDGEQNWGEWMGL